jgi:hypothetical protein
MNKYLTNLNTRERYLLVTAFVFIIIFLIFLSLRSFFDDYSQAKSNLEKASSDYIYVKDKIKNAIKNNEAKAVKSDDVKNFISNNLATKFQYDNLYVSIEEDFLIIEFSTSNLKDGINLIADTANHIEKDVLSLSITKKADSNNIVAKFNI